MCHFCYLGLGNTFATKEVGCSEADKIFYHSDSYIIIMSLQETPVSWVCQRLLGIFE